MRIALICTLVLLAGCARGPTLSEEAARLEHDSHGLLDDGARRLGPPGARAYVRVATNVPCRGGKARRLWRGTVPLRTGPDPRVVLDDATDISIDLGRARGYRLDGPPATARRTRTFSMSRDDSDLRMVVRLRTGRHASLRVDASTPCLPRP